MIASNKVYFADVDTTTFEVADSCVAIRINKDVYHLNEAGINKYPTADTVPAWVNPSFNEDFSIVVSDNAIYKYTANNTYVIVKSGLTLKKNKRIWNTQNKLLVASWNDSLITARDF